ncbi:hypothetical protein [Bradyrhizobium sacchari]|uniref:hypothetical protein n=1 Tax=Bradyrhizobium sacchari TaxID=1399419 RepID=UPI0010A9605B|nr:hypothetical protein [Bradyrhizobium sacchari]
MVLVASGPKMMFIVPFRRATSISTVEWLPKDRAPPVVAVVDEAARRRIGRAPDFEPDVAGAARADMARRNGDQFEDDHPKQIRQELRETAHLSSASRLDGSPYTYEFGPPRPVS